MMLPKNCVDKFGHKSKYYWYQDTQELLNKFLKHNTILTKKYFKKIL